MVLRFVIIFGKCLLLIFVKFIRLSFTLQIPCELDSQFSGMVEAWASGLTWREIMMDCAMDEGDLARLLRRTIDLLAQVGCFNLMLFELKTCSS